MNLSNFTNEVERSWTCDMYGTGCTLQSVVTACILIEVRPDMDAVPPDTPHELVHVILGVQQCNGFFLCQLGTRRTSIYGIFAICRSLVGVHIYIYIYIYICNHFTPHPKSLCKTPRKRLTWKESPTEDASVLGSRIKRSTRFSWSHENAGFPLRECLAWSSFQGADVSVRRVWILISACDPDALKQDVYVIVCFLNTLFLAPVSSKYSRGGTSMFWQCWEGHIRERTSKTFRRWAKWIGRISKVNAGSLFRDLEFLLSRPFSLLSLLSCLADVLSLNRTLQTSSVAVAKQYSKNSPRRVQHCTRPGYWVLEKLGAGLLGKEIYGRFFLFYFRCQRIFQASKRQLEKSSLMALEGQLLSLLQDRIAYIKYIQISFGPLWKTWELLAKPLNSSVWAVNRLRLHHPEIVSWC